MKITRQEAIQKIKSTNGKIFGATFIKKNGDLREGTFRLEVSKGVTGKGLKYDPESRGLMTVFDMSKDAFRMLNVRTLQNIKINHEQFEVSHG